MIGRVKSHIFYDTSKWTPHLSTNFLSQTRNALLPYPLFVVVCRQIDICQKKIHTPAPEKVLFLDLRPNKRHVGWKNNSKHFLFRCCYTNFCPFARKSQLCTRIVGRKIVICGQTNKNEYSSASAKIALNRFSNLHVFFRVSNPKKVFSRGPVCHWRHYLILSSW